MPSRARPAHGVCRLHRMAKKKKSAPISARTATSAPGPPIGRGSFGSTDSRRRPRCKASVSAARGNSSRRRTICGEQLEGQGEPGFGVHLDVDQDVCRRGRVLCVLGLVSMVEDESGNVFRCATRRLLKTLTTDQRHVVAAGDRVLFRPGENTDSREGVIERVEPRRGCICRAVRGRQQVLVANVDQLAIVSSAAEPRLKPNLIDRLLVAAEKGGVRPLLCINKIDLVDPASLQPLVGRICPDGLRGAAARARRPASASSGSIARFAGRANVVAGQSGVGKSSLLNAIDPGFDLHVQAGQRRHREGQAHDDHGPAAAAGRRRLRGRHARHAPVSALGRSARGGGRFLPRLAALRQPLPLSRLHPYARRRLRGERRRGRRPAGRTAL